MVQTLKILTDTYRSRIVGGQSTLKDFIEQYFWNGLSRDPLKVMKALYALYALYAKYANVLKNIHLLKKVKSEIWNQTTYTLGNLLNNTITVRLKDKTLIRVGQGFCVFGIQGRFKSGIRYIVA